MYLPSVATIRQSSYSLVELKKYLGKCYLENYILKEKTFLYLIGANDSYKAVEKSSLIK